MSGSSIGAVAGGLIGGIWGQPQIGMLVGSYLGGVIDPTIIKGPSIGDAQQQTSQAGAPIPKVYGHSPPLGVTLIDGDKIARKITRTEDVGKGATQKTETEAFIATRAFLVCEGEISGYARITRNGKLVYSTMPEDELDAESAAFSSQLTIYTGTETQGPDPSLEAIHGVGNTHYYRGRSYFVVRDDEEVGGAANQYRVEVSACGTVTVPDPDYLMRLGPEFYYKLTEGGTAAIDSTGNHANLDYYGTYGTSGGLTLNDSGTSNAFKSTGTGLESTTTLTVFLKFRLNADPGGPRWIVSATNNSTFGFYQWAFFLVNDGSGNFRTLGVGINNMAGGGQQAYSPFNLEVGVDYLLGLRRNGAVLECLVNGEVVSSVACSGSFSGTASFEIGDHFSFNSAPATYSHLVGVRRAVSDEEAALATLYVGLVGDGIYTLPDAPRVFVQTDGAMITELAAGPTIGPCAAIWKDIVADIANRASSLLPAVLDIDEMDDEVPAFVLGNPALTGTDYVRTLCMYYFVDLPEYDRQIHAIRRGGPIVATFTEDDLLAVEDEDDDTRAPALDAFKRITVMYPDPANNYVATPQTAPRTSPDITTNNTVTLDCPIPFDAETMAKKADILQKIAFLQVEGGFKRAFPAEFSQYVPSDPIMFKDRRHIVVKASNDDSMVRFECQYDRPSAYTSQATPSVAPAPSPQTSNLKGPTVLVAMNLPALRTADSGQGIYLAAMGLLPGWPGADIWLSLDGGETEVKVGSITQPAEIGELAEDLVVGTGSEPAVVTLFAAGALDSITMAQIEARQNAAAVVTADIAEIIQFQTVAQASTGNFELSDLTRAELGTVETDHDAGDTFVTLANAIFLPIDASFAGTTLILRAVTRGTAAANNPTTSLVYDPASVIIDGGEIT